MNKIYKVIWSKVRNCYVAVSEIAKRNGKGGGAVGGAVVGGASVNCEGKAKGKCTALTLAFALCVTGSAVFTMPQVASADGGTITVTDASGPTTEGGVLSSVDIVNKTYYYPSDSAITTLIITDGTTDKGFIGYYSDSNSVSGHKVIVSGGVVENVFGGLTQIGIAGGEGTTGDPYQNGNKVTITGGTIKSEVYGGWSKNGTAIYNQVSISGGTVNANVYGGDASTDATGNKVTITGGTMESEVYGGYSERSGEVTNNTVTISKTDTTNPSITGTVYGGYTQNGTAGGEGTTGDPYKNGNKVTITGGTIKSEVYGGSSINGTAIYNQVSISGGTVNANVYGGDASSNATGNKVTITGGTISSDKIYGGKSEGSGAARYNTVEISGGEVRAVYGGSSINGTAINNQVSINGGTVNGYVYGGQSEGSGAVTNNTVTISKTDTTVPNIDGNVYGGYTKSGTAGGEGPTEDPYKNGNVVTISGGTVTSWVYGGFSSSGAARYNTIEISDGTIGTSERNICGGRGATDATGNKVTITGGTIKSEVYGGYSFDGKAINNQVTITGGIIFNNTSDNESEVYGGYTYKVSGAATGNTVTVNGATITGTGYLKVYGGFSENAGSNVNTNTVNLLGTSKIETTGEFTVSGSNVTNVTGNELHIGGVKGSAETSSANIWTNTGHSVDQNIVEINGINNISNFDKIVLHDVAWNTDPKKPVLYGGTISNVKTLDITNMNIYDGDAFKTTFTPGEKMYLLRSGNSLSGLKLAYDATTPMDLTTEGVTYSTRELVDGNANKFYSNENTVKLTDDLYAVTYTIGPRHIALTDKTGTAGAVTLYAQPSASDAEAGYTVTSYTDAFDIENKRLNLADDFNSLTIADGMWNTLTELYAGYSASGDVTGKTFSITGGTITKTVYGGYTKSGTAGGEVTDTDPYKNGNKVSISGGTVNYWVFGGCSDSGAARYNTIEISGGTITNMVYGGRGATDTTGNKVTITGGTISSSQIYGGFTDLEVGITSVAATGNAVTIEGGDFTNTAIYGGSTQGHNASGNAVTISTINNGALGAVYGGYVDNNSGTAGDSAAGNVVTINGGVVELVYGGLTKIGTAGGEGTSDDPYENGNKVTITGGEVGTVFGGSSNNGTAINNQVSISGGTVNSMVYGGEASTDTTGNKVTIEDGEVGTVYGGFSGEGTAINNQVSISGSTVKVNNRIYGGYSQSGVAGGEGTTEDPYKNGNKVNISGGTVTSWVYGGFSSSGAARYNTIEISDGTIGTSGNNICGGRGATDATGNKVTITGGTIKSEVYGGYSFNGTAINNQVTITGGKVKTVYGGGSDNNCTTSNNQVTISGGEVIDVFGGFTLSGAATGNTVTIEGGEVKTVYGGSSGTGTASNNRVTISGGTVNGEVYGGKGVEANNNTVEISVANFKAASICVGDGATSTGNTLVLGAKGVEVTGTQGVGGVQIIALTDKVQFENNTTVLKADKFSKDSKTAANAANFDGTLDISAATGLQGATAPGVMTLLQSDTENNFTTLDLKYKDATGSEQTVNLSGETTSQIVREGAAQEDERANGVKLVYRNTHTVSVAGVGEKTKNAVNYTVGNVIGSIDLAKWDSTKDAVAVPTGWTANTSGVTVATENMSESGMEAGTSKVILTTDTANYFSDAKISETNKYKEYNFTPSAASGVTLSGKQSKGVRTAESGKNLEYAVSKMVVSDISFGEMKWGTGRAATTDYDFANTATVKASNLSFTFMDTQKAALSKTSKMTLLSDATNLAADKTVTGASRTQQIDFSVANGAALTGTLTGTVSTAAGAVNYAATGMTLNSVDLAKWDGATASAVPTGWTANTSGVTVETDGMTVPEVEAGKHIDILQSKTDNFFTNAKINGDNAYKASDFTEKAGAITFAGSQSKGVTMDSKQNCLIYAVGTKDVKTATLAGEIGWDTSKAYYTNSQYTFSDSSQIVFANDSSFVSETDPLNQSMTLIGSDSAEHAVKGTVSGTPGFTVKMNNTSLDATVTGAATVESGNLKYTVTGVTLNKVTVDSVGSDAVPEGWSTAADVQVDTESMNVPTDAAYGQPQNIMTSDKPVFEDSNITGSNKYGETPAAFTDTDSKETPAVTIAGTQNAGVKASADKKSLVYEVGKKEATSVKLGTVTWAAGSQLMDGSNGEYDYSSVKSVDTGSFAVNYASPQTIDVSKNESMTLLQANDTLKAIVNEEKKQAYSYTPVTGVTMDANIIGRLTNNSGAVTYAPTANKAVSLIFGDVDWLDSGALIDHKTTLTNVSFDGAAVDTTKINFTNKEFMEADKQMTLVSDFGGKPGSITGSKYMVGTGFEGEGSASMEDGNLIFKTRTGAGVSEQTHKTVMAMEADVALLNAGSEHIDNVMTGLGDPANMGEDGTSTSASIGGGGSRYETGSHVSSHTWNAAVGIGRRRELDKGTLEYGIFGEYGKSSYTLHSDAGKGDGDSHHAGGGLLAKWTNKHDVYTEASFRLGRMSNSASNVLRDAAGNGFGYDVHATYYGAHVGVGKIFRYNGGRSLDVYGKFFYTKRNGVNFTAAAQQYDLDSVASSILRIGARYGTTDKKWNWYGGLAYEYEFDGEASGTVNGAAVRAASIKGGSGRAEIGMRMNATKTNPWQADISLYGYAGKHRGFGGNISVAYMF